MIRELACHESSDCYRINDPYIATLIIASYTLVQAFLFSIHARVFFQRQPAPLATTPNTE